MKNNNSRNVMHKPVGLKKSTDPDTGKTHCRGVYGMESALDCSQCDPKTFTRKSLKGYFKGLIKLMEMEAGDLYFWDDVDVPEEDRQTKPETKGTSAVQFILTSNITVHCLDILECVYVNIFSCKEFDLGDAKQFTQNWFKAGYCRQHVLYRR